MAPSDPETVEMLTTLTDARARAKQLLSELLQQHAEVQKKPAALPPDQLEQGNCAFQSAIDAATRMLKTLNEAQPIAANDMN